LGTFFVIYIGRERQKKAKMAIKGLEIEGGSPSINSGCSISLPNPPHSLADGFGRNWQRQDRAGDGLG